MELSKFNSSLLPLILGCTTFFPKEILIRLIQQHQLPILLFIAIQPLIRRIGGQLPIACYLICLTKILLHVLQARHMLIIVLYTCPHPLNQPLLGFGQTLFNSYGVKGAFVPRLCNLYFLYKILFHFIHQRQGRILILNTIQHLVKGIGGKFPIPNIVLLIPPKLESFIQNCGTTY